MSLDRNDLKVSEMDADDKVLFEAGFIDEDKFINSAGWEMLKVVIMRKHKKDLVEMVKKINASKEQDGTQN